MEARLLGGVQLLRAVAESIVGLTRELNLAFSADGVYAQAMDASHVSLVELRLDASKFDHYVCDPGKTVTVGINLALLINALKCCRGDDALTLRHGGDGSKQSRDVLDVVCEGAARTSHFALPLLDLEEEVFGIPEVDYSAVVEMDAALFVHTCKEIKDFGDALAIRVDKAGVALRAESDVAGSAHLAFAPGGAAGADDDVQILKCADALEASYALRYMCLFGKGVALAPRVRLSFHPDTPLRIGIPLAQGLGTLQFYLAPKMDEH